MSEEYSSEPTTGSRLGFQMDAFIPLALLSISVIVLLGWQLSIGSNQKTLMENAITRGEPALNQSVQVQSSVSKLVTDLLQAAQTDDAAKAIASKYKIQAAPPSGPPAQ